jgi:hypothetical protein
MISTGQLEVSKYAKAYGICAALVRMVLEAPLAWLVLSLLLAVLAVWLTPLALWYDGQSHEAS